MTRRGDGSFLARTRGVAATESMRIARVTLLALAITAAATLLVTAWVSYDGLHDARRELVRAQGESLIEAIHQALRAAGRPPSEGDLEQLLEEHASRGLRYVAFVDEARVSQAGTPLGPRPTSTTRRPPIASTRRADHRSRGPSRCESSTGGCASSHGCRRLGGDATPRPHAGRRDS